MTVVFPLPLGPSSPTIFPRSMYIVRSGIIVFPSRIILRSVIRTPSCIPIDYPRDMGVGLLGALVIGGICGPLLAIPRRFGIPVAAGEILIGVILGRTGFAVVPVSDPTLKIFSTIGFALVMLTAGSHVNFRALANKLVMVTTVKIVLLNLVLSLGVGVVVAHFTGV